MARGQTQRRRGFQQIAGIVPEVRLVLAPRLRVSFGDIDADAPANLPIACRIPNTLTAGAEILGALTPQFKGGQGRQDHIRVALLGHPLHGLWAAGARDPDRWMWLLVRFGP